MPFSPDPQVFPKTLKHVRTETDPLRAGEVFFRMYWDLNGNREPLGYGRSLSRFSDPEPDHRFEPVYLAEDLETAFVETVVRLSRVGQDAVFVDEFALTCLRVARIFISRPLQLIDLTAGALVQASLHPNITGAADHAPGRELATLVHEGTSLDGLLYHSFLTHTPCLALFDRALGKLHAAPHENFLGPGFIAEAESLLEAYGVVIGPSS